MTTDTGLLPTTGAFPCARFIKELGRGPNGSRALSGEESEDLYQAMLDGQVSEVELGAVLLAYRVKGEEPTELAGMLRAAHRSFNPLIAPGGPYRSVSIPSYNGARKQPNLTPMLALLLARRGVPVLMHGVTSDPGRITSAEILPLIGIEISRSHADVEAALAGRHVAFMPIETLAPKMARLLALRRVLGVRNSTHTLVKLLQPFSDPGLRLVNYTHPAYRDSLSTLFTSFPEAASGGALLARGTEGEAVADTRRQVQVDWLHDGVTETLLELESRDPSSAPAALPEARDAETTARWIERVMADEEPVPESIARQVEIIVRVAGLGRP
jgi:anthranilate phosphoribosyltransferase